MAELYLRNNHEKSDDKSFVLTGSRIVGYCIVGNKIITLLSCPISLAIGFLSVQSPSQTVATIHANKQ